MSGITRCSELVYWSSKWIVDALKATLIAVNMDPDAVQVNLIELCASSFANLLLLSVSWSAVIRKTRTSSPNTLLSSILPVSRACSLWYLSRDADRRLCAIVIGSEQVGQKVATAAAESLIPTCIELGGKDCAVLLPTTNLKFFASTYMRAAL
jgi:hypothetical protein